MRVLCLVLVLIAVPVGRAWATAQEPEVLVLNGRVHYIFSTPLAPLLEDREDLEKLFEPISTACWRGYVGTWAVEGDRFSLVSLRREVYVPELDDPREEGDYVTKSIPLSTLFGVERGPVEATWFSGTLRVPRSHRHSYVHMGFGTTYEKELHIEILRGRVVRQRVVNTRVENRGRSEQDREWVSIASAAHASAPVEDDGKWTDGRAIDTVAFREAVPPGRPFLTRGLLDREGDDGPVILWIPETLVTDEVMIPVVAMPKWPGDAAWPHVEIEATWEERDGELRLRVRWYRLLRPGETIHHPEYPLPDLPPDSLTDIEGELDPDDFEPIATREEVEDAFEAGIALHGVLKAGDPSQVLGVDVAGDPALVGKRVVVRGMLEKWIITKPLLELDHADHEPFRSRGPGTYYRLVDPSTGRLATPEVESD